MDMLVIILILWVVFGGLALIVVLGRFTNAFAELHAFTKFSPVVWMIRKAGINRKQVPKRVAYGFAFFDNKETKNEVAYPIWVYATGKTREAIAFEDMAYPVNFDFMRWAMTAKAKGFPDYTALEVAVILKQLFIRMPELNGIRWDKPLAIVDETTGKPKRYARVVDYIQEEFLNMGGNPWFAAPEEIRQALENALINRVDDEAIDLFYNMRNFATHNASAAVYEDIVMNARIKEKHEAYNAQGGLTSFVKTHWIEIGVFCFMIMLGVAVFTMWGGLGKLFGSGAVNVIATTTTTLITTTTLPPTNIPL